jgi:hypothetical protein
VGLRAKMSKSQFVGDGESSQFFAALSDDQGGTRDSSSRVPHPGGNLSLAIQFRSTRGRS